MTNLKNKENYTLSPSDIGYILLRENITAKVAKIV